MGKRGKGSHTKVEKPVDKDKEKSSTEQTKSNLISNEGELEEIVDKKLESSQVVIEYKCRLLAEKALCEKTVVSNNTTLAVVPLKETRVSTVTSEKKIPIKVCSTPPPPPQSIRRQSPRRNPGGKISQEPTITVTPTNRRRRKALTRALQRLRGNPQSKKTVVRKTRSSLRVSPRQTRCSSKMDHMDDMKERESSPSVASNNGSPDYSPESDDDLSNDGQNESDSELEMQVLEKQVESEKEEEDDGPPADVSLNLPDDTDEESSLLSPSALPASQLFRSPSSRRKKRKSHSEVSQTTTVSENPSKQLDTTPTMQTSTPVNNPSYSRSLAESSMSSSSQLLFHTISPVSSSNISSISGSSGPLPGKRGRGRPRKALEDVKSVSGKLYRKKLAAMSAASAMTTGSEASRGESIYDFEDLHHSETLAPYTSTVYDDDFDPRDPTVNALEDFYNDELAHNHHDAVGDPSDPENFHQRLQRWKDRSTFVYAKHKFVSNENKFKCDTCQVSFTALSSLKRHYGTIYHKQQEAAGRSTLDLSDILRPERDGDMSSGRGRGRGRPPLARTTSFVRRSAVDNIKKYYAAADAARRRRENYSAGGTGGGGGGGGFTTSSWLQKQQRKRKPLLHADYLYPSASADSEVEDGDDDDDDFGCEDEENHENNLPENGRNIYDEAPDTVEDVVVQTPWLSNVWKGIGPPHFTCEVCGEKYTKKFEFTKHLFQHRQEEAKQLELTCPDCLVVLPNDNMLENHFNLFNHGIGVTGRPGRDVKKLTCPKCNSKFTRRDYYRKHLEVHKRPLLKCLHCPKKFLHKFYLSDHVKAKHDDPGCHGWNATMDNNNGTTTATVGSNLLGTSVSNPIISIPKPKVELYSSTTPLLIPSETDKRKTSSSVASGSDDTIIAQATTTSATTSNDIVPQYITCDLFGETPVPAADRDHQSSNDKERVSLIQKFFDSQKEQDSQSTVVECNSTTEDGKIVFQLEHSMFKGLDENACNMSPLTIEIPRDNIDNDGNDRNNDIEVVESEENDERSNDIDGSLTQKISTPPPQTEEMENKNESLMHSTNSNSSTTFQLQGCGVKLNLNVTLEPENELQCQDCGKIFEHKKSLIKHVRYYQQVESYPCTLCDKSFKLKHHVSRHIKSFHNVDTNSTTSSASDDENSAGLLAIPSSSSSSPAASSSSLGTERKRSVSDAGRKKEEGDVSFSKSNYTIVTDSNGTTAYKCLICKKLYPSKHQISSHLSYHKRSIPYKCSVCSAEFKVKQELINHQQLHDYEKTKFVCEKCPNGKSFLSRKDLLKHMREKHDDHDELTISRCPSCPLVFPQESDLQAHISQEHNNKKGSFETFEDFDEQDFVREREQGQPEEDQPTSPIQLPQQDQINEQHQPREAEPSASSPEFELLELN